jgi:tetraacyldisaccharide 4'-kinase
LLTEYKDLYTRDLLLPAGDLRDLVNSSKRADIIIVTKCKTDLGSSEKEQIIKELAPLKHQSVFFTEIVYTQPYHLFERTSGTITHNTDVLLLCGIANPRPLKEFLASYVHTYDMLRYADHHIFTSDDLKDIKKQFEKIQSPDKILLTTEKDAVRLEKFRNELKEYPIYVMPIKHSFLFGEAAVFENMILEFIAKYPARQKEVQ